MSDSMSEYYDDLTDYDTLRELLGDKKRDDETMYDHLERMKGLPCIYWENGKYKADRKNYPEYFL